MGWALIRGWALINFFCLWDGRLFEVGANSRLGAYSNKYGSFSLLKTSLLISYPDLLLTKSKARFLIGEIVSKHDVTAFSHVHYGMCNSFFAKSSVLFNETFKL